MQGFVFSAVDVSIAKEEEEIAYHPRLIECEWV